VLKTLFDSVMERRCIELVEHVRCWLPAHGRVLDIGSGTGHLAGVLERETELVVVAADVTDMHVTGPAPILLTGDGLPFDDGAFSAALLIFMLHYPEDPARLLREAARVTSGPVIVMQSVHAGRAGLAWLRVREFLWSWVAFHVSKAIGYVPRHAVFTMSARRFYTSAALQRDVAAAGLRVRTAQLHPILPAGALAVAVWVLEEAGIATSLPRAAAGHDA
jgi:SAM-dependent methyltransferase